MLKDPKAYVIQRARSSALVADLIDLVGLDDTRALLNERGGERVYIPAESTDGHWLTRCMGAKAAKTVRWHFGGEHLTLPLGNNIKCALREIEIYQARENGQRVKDIARTFECTERTVRKILERLGKPCADNPVPQRGKHFDPWKRKSRAPKNGKKAKKKSARDTDKQTFFEF